MILEAENDSIHNTLTTVCEDTTVCEGTRVVPC